MEFETKDLTIEDLANYARDIIYELKARYYDLSGTYKDVWESKGDLEDEYSKLKSRYNELKEKYEDLKEDYDEAQRRSKEDNDVLDEEFGQFQYDCGYEKGFEEGEYSMQKKAYKICEYWNNNDTDVLSKLFDGWTWTQIFEDIETSYNKIAEYEKKEKEIKVGDEVVDCDGTKYVVRFLNDSYADALAYNGVSVKCDYADVSKTGKHYPLEEILKELK